MGENDGVSLNEEDLSDLIRLLDEDNISCSKVL